MPTLNWMGKEKVVNHHRDVPYRVLERVPEKGVLDSHGSDCGNMIIHGDNLEALKALLPEYEGKVDCIYIDPPYNTGNEGWVYNDNVNDPRIKKWLGQVVGKEGEDFSRHDKWLCMMYPRLQLLRRLLSPTGLIFISIDDNELANLWLLCNEIFAPSNFVTCISWEKRFTRSNNAKMFASVIEYVLVFRRSGELSVIKAPRTEKNDSIYSNPDNDSRGVWTSVSCVNPATKEQRPNLVYPMTNPFTGEEVIHPTNAWKFEHSKYEQYERENRLYWGQDGRNTYPRLKRFLSELGDGVVPVNLWNHEDSGTTDSATRLVQTMLPEQKFDTPKPPRLIERCVELCPKADALVLDSFAGSGTTAQAVLDLNAFDGGNRRFVLIEMGDYADELTAERARRTISGFASQSKRLTRVFEKKLTSGNLNQAGKFYEEALAAKAAIPTGTYDKVEGPKMDGPSIVVDGVTTSGSIVPGVDSGFSYYELGLALFQGDGTLSPDVTRADLARYVWATETRAPYEDLTDEHPYLLGEHAQAVYYLAWEPGEETTLTYDLLRDLPRKGSPTVIYADRCAIAPERLDEMSVVFKRVPDQIARI
ncbi:site-specific DNA-methyltransferase [uncultured Enorma sp.]|uniref:site-specific DNA-methyltransferase n=1 Tax=uncultured Enorma sp. TaxID=1714346 RepID=UPI002628839C|nr:site-specific DNA-methyltransferase [uncultured Enorma sp.]